MKWQFEIYYNSKRVKINAEVVYSSSQIERIKLTTDTQELLLQNNRPLLQAKNLNRKRILWKIMEGSVKSAHAFVLMTESIEAYLKDHGKKPYINPKNF